MFSHYRDNELGLFYVTYLYLYQYFWIFHQLILNIHIDSIEKLQDEKIKLNITAITTFEQVLKLNQFLRKDLSIYLSIFAGRIADTGVDPSIIMSKSIELYKDNKNLEFIWASPRELLNIFQADSLGCHIITVTENILNKINLIGKDLDEYSLETVKMFYNDAISAKLKV